MTINKLADFLDLGPAILFDGNYRNKRNRIGYYVQLQCGEHWIKVSVSNVSSLNGGISSAELSAMTQDKLVHEAPASVPLKNIATAIRHIGSRGTGWKSYENAVFVPGVWLEDKVGEHWYMVWVSHVDALDKIAPEKVDSSTDEFLRRMGALSGSIRPVTRKRKNWI
jgi:hypothetical protein